MKIFVYSASLVLACVVMMNAASVLGYSDQLDRVFNTVSWLRLSDDLRANEKLVELRDIKYLYRDAQYELEVAILHSSKNFDELANEKFLSKSEGWRRIAFYCANRTNSKIANERLRNFAIDSLQSGDEVFLRSMTIGVDNFQSPRMFELGMSLYAEVALSESEKDDLLVWLSYFNKLGTPTSNKFLKLLLEEAPSKFEESGSNIYKNFRFKSTFAEELDANFLLNHTEETIECFSKNGMLENYLTWYQEHNDRRVMRPLQLKVILTEEIQSEHQAKFLEVFSQHEKG